MAVDAADKEIKALEEENTEDKLQQKKVLISQGHWKLGAPEKSTTTKKIETAFQGTPAYHGFQKNLFNFLRHVFPEEIINRLPLKVLSVIFYMLRIIIMT